MTAESQLHTAIIRHVAERGFAPAIEALGETLGWSDIDVRTTLTRLAEIRGLILKPNSFDVVRAGNRGSSPSEHPRFDQAWSREGSH